jgi:hypothetical protein
MPVTTDAEDREEWELKMDTMRADLKLKTKQSIWENPRNIAILVGATAAVIGAIAGWTGYRIGSAPPQQINIHLDAPLTVTPAVKP